MQESDRKLVSAVIVLLAVIAIELGGPWVTALVTPNPCQAVSETDNQAGTNQRSAAPSASTVPSRQPPNEEAQSTQPNKGCDTNSLVAAYTGELAHYTLWLMVATIVLGFVGAYQGYYSGKSAKTSERALTELERPFLYAEGDISEFSIWSQNPLMSIRQNVRLGVATLKLISCGRTAAIITRLQWDIVPATHGGIPPAVNAGIVGGREIPAGIVAYEGKSFTETENLRFRFDNDQNERIAMGEDTLWLIGFVRYASIFRGNYIYGFSLAFDAAHRVWVARGGAQYNYTSEEMAENIPIPA